MKAKAAVLWEIGKGWEITEVEVDPPKENEILIHFAAAGLCHSDYHLITGDIEMRRPMIGGHEGAGIVEAVGPGVTRLKPGDHVITCFVPACGQCVPCVTGHSNLCDYGRGTAGGSRLDGTFRFHARGEEVSAMNMLGTFSNYSVISEAAATKIDDSIPLDVAALIGCAVPTGWGSAVKAADVYPGDTVVIYGVGGVGINAVQGAKFAGAKHVVAVDPIAFKREKALQMGATHVAASAEEAKDLVWHITNGVWANKAIITAGVVDEKLVNDAFEIISKGGTLVITGLSPAKEKAIHLQSNTLTLWEKRIQGTIYGSMNFHYDVHKLLGLYKEGYLKLDELITTKYKLEDINKGYEDLIEGKNIRGLVIHER